MAGTHFELNTGAFIPAIGFGTWQDVEGHAKAVETALRLGYRHVDTASMYGTEQAVGTGIRASGVPREDIFLVTKLWSNKHDPADVESAIDASLNALGTDYVDLWLMHWPAALQSGDDLFPKDSSDWHGMEAVYGKGKARALGVSNFSQNEMERLLEHGNVVPAVHQLECHPYLAQPSFNDWHKARSIHVTQFNPFSNANPYYTKHPHVGKLLDHSVMVEVAAKYRKSTAQVALAWGIAHGRTVIPKSTTESRIRDNLEADFTLAPGDVQKIDKLDQRLRFLDASDIFGYVFFSDLEDKRASADGTQRM
ncbi:hypothetical protein M409DRAFT_66085 [Zasmidium cellare ATCC 36951]|uniref:NADP-dependent oxidoreductase domain-containing protein n=1 Tax=Zasmidium cellare ATCC 36951 TaxID=1080233 RepID=A0A6A6CK25_ZASCE|nr:uncharacterized protein M409DRAFT_66085 [Zasmidium cellare ATCC 36951]KAF2167587.1 hypothetical protein M409DRAFT_66085 [Zasmidium cellare ATCC 36951]